MYNSVPTRPAEIKWAAQFCGRANSYSDCRATWQERKRNHVRKNPKNLQAIETPEAHKKKTTRTTCSASALSQSAPEAAKIISKRGLHGHERRSMFLALWRMQFCDVLCTSYSIEKSKWVFQGIRQLLQFYSQTCWEQNYRKSMTFSTSIRIRWKRKLNTRRNPLQENSMRGSGAVDTAEDPLQLEPVRRTPAARWVSHRWCSVLP